LPLAFASALASLVALPRVAENRALVEPHASAPATDPRTQRAKATKRIPFIGLGSLAVDDLSRHVLVTVHVLDPTCSCTYLDPRPPRRPTGATPLLGALARLFVQTVLGFYAERMRKESVLAGKSGAVVGDAEAERGGHAALSRVGRPRRLASRRSRAATQGPLAALEGGAVRWDKEPVT
jgi:hypothetical protein